MTKSDPAMCKSDLKRALDRFERDMTIRFAIMMAFFVVAVIGGGALTAHYSLPV
jgi:hypothetical protein